jgi:hypothetical protein
MKRNFIVLAAYLLICFSCTKTINVDLKTAAPQLVIEGIINDQQAATVIISKSVPFSSSNTFPAVSGATVIIEDNHNNSYTLPETSAGTYSNPLLTGIPGTTYTLTVTVAGKPYTSISTMPAKVKLDTILFENFGLFGKSTWSVKPQYTDPPNFGNYYKFYESINNRKYPSYWIWDDRLTNNGISTRPLLQTDSIIHLGDSVEVEMQCIDENVYKYFVSLLDTQLNNTVPANPTSNISGGCLGYFSAQTSQKKKLKVQ